MIVGAQGRAGAADAPSGLASRVAQTAHPEVRNGGHEPHMQLMEMACDVLVAGGGLAGVCAALAAARNGARVVLVQDRARLGGNSSSEVKMHVVGANCHKGRPGWRESGIIEELRLEDAVRNPQRCFELWDLLLYDKIISEPNISLLLDTAVFAAEMNGSVIGSVLARCDTSERIYRIRANVYCDCTGDSRLALEAGAEIRYGRESRAAFGESLAPEVPDEQTMGSSILFTSREHDRPMPFRPPAWARKVTAEHLKFRSTNAWEYGYWWIEWGGELSTIQDNDRIRFELLSIVMGVWDYIKNSGNHPASANWALDWVGMLPGRREARRLIGDYTLRQQDLLSGDFSDAVAIGGWPMDDHPPGGFDRPDLPPANQVRIPRVYDIPLRCLYSRNVSNLIMAGRNISATHVALSSTRVMATCSVIGQAAGTAAALCARARTTPHDFARSAENVRWLQQVLLRDDQTIRDLRNEDRDDLARLASVCASAESPGTPSANVINGVTRDIPGGSINRWSAPQGPGGAWIELSWPKPQSISCVQITFDSGFARELTLSASDDVNEGIIRGPQPETVKDYEIQHRPDAGGEFRELVEVRGNHQRLKRHVFQPVKTEAIRVHVSATNGDALARIFEIRCYS